MEGAYAHPSAPLPAKNYAKVAEETAQLRDQIQRVRQFGLGDPVGGRRAADGG